MITAIMDWLKKHGWLEHDKWAHAWLHTIIVRSLRSFGVDLWTAFLVSFVFGLVYEMFDRKFITQDWKDGLKDMVANVIGACVGIVI